MTGWNPQDPYGQQGGQGGQYGSDPYGQQHGADPYGGQPHYGSDAYPGGPQYGAEQYNPYAYGQQPSPYPDFSPEPPKRSKLPIILSIIAIVAVVGTVVTIVLLNRDSSEPSAGPGPSSSTAAPTSRSTLPTSRRQSATSTKPPGKDGWITVAMAGGSYQVPPDWKKSSETRKSGLGVDFTGGAVNGEYECGGAEYWRGFTATGEVAGKDGAALDLNKTVTDFAKSFAGQFYRDPKVDAPAPKETSVDGKKAAVLTAKLTVTPTKPECDATSGEVAVIGVQIEGDGKPAGVRMLVVVNDLAGGPDKPKAVPDPVAEEILDTLTVN